MAKILITADIHIHAHRNDVRRVEDGLNCLRWIYETARDTDCCRVVLAGDFLHSRFSLNAYAYAKACRLVSDFADQGLKTIFLLGNHDMYFEDNWTVHSLVPIKDWALVADKPQTVDIDGYPVDLLPYTPTPIRYLEGFKNPSPLLVSHLSVAEALLHATCDILSVEDDSKEKEVISPDVFKPWNKTFLGHYHYGQRVGSDAVEYVGSPYQLTFGEANQTKRVVIYDLDKQEAKYVVNDKSPKFHIVNDEDKLDDLNLEHSYVQMRTKEDIHSKFGLRKKLSKLGAREIEFVTKPVDMAKAQKALNNITDFVRNKTQLVTEYVDLVKVRDDLDRAKLKKIGISIISEV
jgi:DNA repair exonuclease SbcCD nuclease subunit